MNIIIYVWTRYITIANTIKTNFISRNLKKWSGELTMRFCDYFLWGYVKSNVYADKPDTIEQLEANIPKCYRRHTSTNARVVEHWATRQCLLHGIKLSFQQTQSYGPFNDLRKFYLISKFSTPKIPPYALQSFNINI